MSLSMPVTKLKGIGEKKAKSFQKLGIQNIEDLIHYYPRGYEANQGVRKIADLSIEDFCVIQGEVSEGAENIRAKAMMITRVKLKDSSGSILVVWYRQPYLKNQFKLGQSVLLKGRITKKYGQLCIESPKILREVDLENTKDQELLPIYRLTKELSGRTINDAVRAAMLLVQGQIKDHLSKEIKIEHALCEINYALQQIHNPTNQETLNMASHRLIFDEFLLFQLGMKLLKNENYASKNIYQFKSEELVNKLVESLPYKLTNAQEFVWKEIKADLRGFKTMNRLVQGDVGSGKTIIAAMSLLLAIENGYQGAMMAPTEVLAKQHYKSLQEVLMPLNIKVGLLVGSMKKKQKLECLEELASGDIQLLVGTHAIIQEGVQFKQLALVITDEQHRFGVKQREKLSEKAVTPHTLVMSATPIPRTLALVVYGDMDVSIIDELPPGRQVIKTVHVGTSYRERIYKFMITEISEGRQCYIVCPMVEENEEMDLESVEEYATKLKEWMPEHIRIAYLYGKMKPSEKNSIMERFSSGEIDILISTTVIEVGVNVPNATIMLIENAERFGLSGLHQLRGRVGRGKHQSHCILLTDSKADITKQRMNVLVKSNDGFVISEMDLKLRGPGDAFGIKQHGLPELRIGSLFENVDILKVTGELASQIILKDPKLESEHFSYLNEVCNRYFKERVGQISL